MDKKYMYNTGATLGRFQPFNLGHKYMVDILLSLCQKVCIIVSDDMVINERNPFSKELRKEMIEAVYPDEVKLGRLVIGYKVSGQIKQDAWGALVLQLFYNNLGTTPQLIMHGDEQSRRNWFNEQQRDNITEIFVANHPVVDGKILDFRSTYVRNSILNNDYESFKTMVDPSLYLYFNLLKRELEKVDE